MKTLTSQPLRFAGVAALALLLAAGFGLPLLAQPGQGPGFGPRLGQGPCRGDGPGPRGGSFASDRLVRALDLSEAQVEQAKAIHEDLRAEMQPLHEEGMALRADLRDLLDAEARDAEAVGAATLALDEHRERARALKDEAKADFRAILTPEQLERWDALQEMRGQGRRGMRHHGRLSGPPL